MKKNINLDLGGFTLSDLANPKGEKMNPEELEIVLRGLCGILAGIRGKPYWLDDALKEIERLHDKVSKKLGKPKMKELYKQLDGTVVDDFPEAWKKRGKSKI